jgi:hypothetical protein
VPLVILTAALRHSLRGEQRAVSSEAPSPREQLAVH